MSIDYTTAKSQVAQIQEQLDARVAEIRGNRSLTAAGKRREIAAATLEARRLADTAKSAFAAEREQRRDSMRRIAFGNYSNDVTATDHVSMRDAHDRAAKLEKADDANTLLERAILDSDEPLAKAVAARAHERGWGDVVRRYGAMFDRQTFIDKLAEEPAGPNTRLADDVVFRLRSPQELNGHTSDTDLERLVDTEVQ